MCRSQLLFLFGQDSSYNVLWCCGARLGPVEEIKTMFVARFWVLSSVLFCFASVGWLVSE